MCHGRPKRVRATDQAVGAERTRIDEETSVVRLERFQIRTVKIGVSIMVLLFLVALTRKSLAHPVGWFELIMYPLMFAVLLRLVILLRNSPRNNAEMIKRLPPVILVEAILFALFVFNWLHFVGLDTVVSRVAGPYLGFVANALLGGIVGNAAWALLTLLAKNIAKGVVK